MSETVYDLEQPPACWDTCPIRLGFLAAESALIANPKYTTEQKARVLEGPRPELEILKFLAKHCEISEEDVKTSNCPMGPTFNTAGDVYTGVLTPRISSMEENVEDETPESRGLEVIFIPEDVIEESTREYADAEPFRTTWIKGQETQSSKNSSKKKPKNKKPKKG